MSPGTGGGGGPSPDDEYSSAKESPCTFCLPSLELFINKLPIVPVGNGRTEYGRRGVWDQRAAAVPPLGRRCLRSWKECPLSHPQERDRHREGDKGRRLAGWCTPGKGQRRSRDNEHTGGTTISGAAVADAAASTGEPRKGAPGESNTPARGTGSSPGLARPMTASWKGNRRVEANQNLSVGAPDSSWLAPEFCLSQASMRSSAPSGPGLLSLSTDIYTTRSSADSFSRSSVLVPVLSLTTPLPPPPTVPPSSRPSLTSARTPRPRYQTRGPVEQHHLSRTSHIPDFGLLATLFSGQQRPPTYSIYTVQSGLLKHTRYARLLTTETHARHDLSPTSRSRSLTRPADYTTL